MSDYNFLMETRLSPERFQVIHHLGRVASGQSLNLYLTGGAVRDLTYGQQIVRDLDFTVEGKPEKILKQLEAKPHAGSEAVPFHIAFARYARQTDSAEVVFSNGVRAEISMARAETYERPGRRPFIEPTTIFEDLRRRDFSVNAMAISLHPNSRGLLLDPTNGASDIERRELRALHSRSFSEDPVRIYRLLRLGLRLNFKVEERTEIWRNSSLNYGAADRLDTEQQGRELAAILREDNPGRILKALVEQRLLGKLDLKLASRRLPYDQFAKIRAVGQSIPGTDTFLLNLHCLVSRMGSSQRKRLAAKIVLDRREAKAALGMEDAAKKLARALRSSKAGQSSQVFSFLDGQSQYLLLFLLAYFPQAKLQNRVKNFLFKFPTVRARIPRSELLTLGLERGPKFEKIIHQLFLMQLDGKIKSHPQLLKEFRSLAGIKEPPKPAAKHAPPKPAKAAKPAKAVPPQRVKKPVKAHPKPRRRVPKSSKKRKKR